MGATLPPLSRGDFEALLRGLPLEGSTRTVAGVLLSHYEELRRWNTKLSLVGPGTAREVLARHYGEALAALQWLPETGTLVDVGSGAGFPGVVLAAARPRLEVTLVEPRLRKWAFLEACRRATGLSYQTLDARVGDPLPAGLPERIDLVTSRAVRITPALIEPLLDRSPALRLLLWQGEASPSLPPGAQLLRERRIAGSERRRLLEIVWP